MRCLVKVSIPVEAGNHAMKTGAIPKKIEEIIAMQKPEAAYFITENGVRTALLFLQLNDSSELAGIAEPWFLAFNADVDVTPAMTADDLKKAGPAIMNAVKKFG